MVNALVGFVRRILNPATLEVAGASAVTYGLYVAFGSGAALVAAGVELLAKSVEIEAR